MLGSGAELAAAKPAEPYAFAEVAGAAAQVVAGAAAQVVAGAASGSNAPSCRAMNQAATTPAIAPEM
jgi:hypothetical protein